MAEILKEALWEAGMKVQTEPLGRRDALSIVAECQAADVLIVPLGSTRLSRLCTEVMRSYPHTKVITVAASDREAAVFELRLLGADAGRKSVVDAVLKVTARAPSH
jgi:DNA-binding NarL/FixJ family response regulator